LPVQALVALYLHSDGRANSSKGDGTLTAEPPSNEESPDIFVYDPEVPVLAPGGIATASGPLNQAALEMGNNVLVYTTEPLRERLHVFGSPEVWLHCATSAAHADFVAKLVCVREMGEAMFVCLGIARSQQLFAAGYESDTSTLWRFALEPTSCVFHAGDRLRLEIASSAYPLYDRNPSTDIAAREADSWNWARSTQTIFHDALRPSALHLPLAEVG
jgi:putative CocE/NonD family hydrolase